MKAFFFLCALFLVPDKVLLLVGVHRTVAHPQLDPRGPQIGPEGPKKGLNAKNFLFFTKLLMKA